MRVPGYETQQQTRALPVVSQQVATPQGMFGDGGRVAGELANALSNVDAAYQRERDLADQTRVDEAMNKWKEYQLDLTFNPESGYTTQKGAQAMYRPSGKPLTEEYYENANTYSTELEGSLGNDRQKALFRQKVAGQLTGFKGDLMRYEGQEFRNYQVSVQDGKIATDVRTVASYYNNPEKIDESVASIRQAIYTSGRIQGMSAEEINARTTAMVSKAHIGALAQAMEQGNVMYADQYLKTYKDQMTPEDLLTARSKIGEQVETVVATQVAGQVFSAVETAANPDDMQRVIAITMNAESGGKRYAKDYGLRVDGTRKGSGYLGELKMKDGSGDVATEISVGVNIDGKETEIPALVPTLSESEVDHLLKGGKPTDEIVRKATEHARKRIAQGKSPFANDGQLLTSPKGAKGEMQVMDGTNRDPGFGVTPARDDSPDERARVGREYLGAMVKKYNGDLSRAWAAYNAGPAKVDEALAAAAKEGNPSAWLSKLPTETQNYVRKNSAAFASGGGRAMEPTIDQLKAELRKRPEFAERPEALRKAEDEIDRRYADYQKGVKQRQDSSLAEAFKYVESGGSFDTMPARIKNGLDPTKFGSVREYEKKVRGGDVQTNLAVYQLLSADPKRVREMSDDQFYALRSDLSPTDFKKFADMRADKVNAKDNPEGLSFEAINQVLTPRLRAMGLPQTGSTPADQQRAGAIRQHIADVVLQQQQALGRKLTDAELVKVIDDRFLATRAFKSPTWWGLGESEVRKQNVVRTKVGDIPSDMRRQIEQDFKDQGIDKPSDQDILGAFLALDYSLQQRE